MNIKIISVLLFIGLIIASSSFAQIEVKDVGKRVQEMGLDTLRNKTVLIYFDSRDKIRAKELATLALSMTEYYEKEFNLSFKFKIAALRPEHWFSEFPGMPYAVPWNFIPDRIVMIPSLLNEGILINKDKSQQENKLYVDYIFVHEYSHFLEKDYFRPLDKNNYLNISWFGEFIVNYFAYAYVHSINKKWSEEIKKMWKQDLKSFTPKKFTLNWSFMHELPPEELGPTYGWYQQILNFKASELFEIHGLNFLRTLKKQLSWQECENWDNKFLIKSLDDIYPGFIKWSDNIASYSKEVIKD